MRVKLTPKAQADLREMGRWIAQDSPIRAKTYVAEVRQKCLSLGEQSERASIVSRSPEVLRRIVHGSYVIFYVVRPGRVVVLSVVHAALLQDPSEMPD